MDKLIICILFCFNSVSDYVLETEDFRVVLPSKPKYQVLEVNINNELVPLHMYIVERPPFFYVVSYGSYPKSVNLTNTEKFFKGVMNQMAANYKGEVISEENNDSLSPNNGKGFVIKLPDQNYVHVNCFLKDRTLYQVIVQTASEEIKSKDATTCFKSFKLK